MNKVILFIFALVLLSGCADNQANVAPLASSSPAPIVTPTPVPTATPVPDPTATPKPTAAPKLKPTPAPAPAAATSKYQQIYNEYARKIRAAAPRVGITELAEINNEGMSKMAEYMYSASGTDGQYATYEKWAGKLMDVYMSEAR